MSQQELSDFFESCRRVFTLLFPFLMVGLVTSFVDFLQKHLGKERFKLTKLIVGMISDMFLAFVVTCIGRELDLGSYGIAAMVAILTWAVNMFVFVGAWLLSKDIPPAAKELGIYFGGVVFAAAAGKSGYEAVKRPRGGRSEREPERDI